MVKREDILQKRLETLHNQSSTNLILAIIAILVIVFIPLTKFEDFRLEFSLEVIIAVVILIVTIVRGIIIREKKEEIISELELYKEEGVGCKKESSLYSPAHFAKEVIPHWTNRNKHDNKIEEKEDTIVLFILMGVVSIGIGIWFWFYNKINLIPLALSVFVITPAFEKTFNAIFKKNKFKWVWWRKALLVSAIIIFFVIINLLIPECPKSCDDTNRCTNDFCSQETGFKCMNVLKLKCNGNDICEAGEYGKSTDCPNCDDGNKCTADSYDLGTKTCMNMKIKGCIA